MLTELLGLGAAEIAALEAEEWTVGTVTKMFPFSRQLRRPLIRGILHPAQRGE